MIFLLCILIRYTKQKYIKKLFNILKGLIKKNSEQFSFRKLEVKISSTLRITYANVRKMYLIHTLLEIVSGIKKVTILSGIKVI